MFTYLLYALAAAGLTASFIKDRKKTRMALKKAWKAFENILPQFLSILVIIGLAFAVLTPETITGLLGANSGVWGVLVASLIGSITLIPGFVAFPLAAALLKSGAAIRSTFPLTTSTSRSKSGRIQYSRSMRFSPDSPLSMSVRLRSLR